MGELLNKIPYGGKYPSAAEMLIREGITSAPKQYEKDLLQWAEGIDIVYTLKDMTPVNFKKYADTLLLLAFQEATRYIDARWKFAGFDVKLGRLPKGKELTEYQTYQAAMHNEPDIMVYGEKALGYETPQKYYLINKVEDILDIVNRYLGRVTKQAPYKVVRLIISIRQPKPKIPIQVEKAIMEEAKKRGFSTEEQLGDKNE